MRWEDKGPEGLLWGRIQASYKLHRPAERRKRIVNKRITEKIQLKDSKPAG